MDIQFSAQQASEACESLSQEALNIRTEHNSIEAINNNIDGIWSGSLSETIVGGLRLAVDKLTDVKAFVDSIDSHIAVCRQNYQLTESKNKQALEDINSMFL